MPKEFIMRGQTKSGESEILNMGTPTRNGYGYVMTDFALYPSTNIHSATYEITGTVTAGNTAAIPTDPNFNDDGLIATASIQDHYEANYVGSEMAIINDAFVITQDLILLVRDSAGSPINWQCKFKEVKLTAAAEAVANYKQYTIYNTSS